MNFFITGTDTGVGKTFVTALLIRALRKAGLDTVGMKPVCCGDRTDAELLHAAADGAAELNDINPIWFRTPAAPYTASVIENRMIDLDAIREYFAKLRKAHRSLLVEGIGGWMVPIRKDYFVSDLAAEFGLPVVVVVPNRLGTLNHALLTIRAIQSSGQECAGIIFNNVESASDDISTATNRSMLEDLAGVPVLFEIEKNQQELVLGIG
ncbi:MAG: dethiobiotin synthase [Verrucomicrobiota bacterium]